MKKLITTSLVLLCFADIFAQCPNTTGNYEFAITNDARNITIKARNTTRTIRSSYVDPAINGNFVGMVYGVKWSAKSDINLYKVNSTSPFHIIPSGGILEKNEFKFQSYGDAADNLPKLSENFMDGEWHTVAVIPYTGTLNYGDRFELAECGFDETTNPYFAQMDTYGNYGQFAPNLTRNTIEGTLTVANAVIVYPNPTSGNLFVDVSSSQNTVATFRIMDMTGKIINVIQSDIQEGLNHISLNVNSLPDGIYMIKVIDGKSLNYAQTFYKQQ